MKKLEKKRLVSVLALEERYIYNLKTHTETKAPAERYRFCVAPLEL